MLVDFVLVLAAGKGTRMGEIGKRIPKVLWPIYRKSILELEVLYAQKYCQKDIFVNVYNYKEILKNEIETNPSFADVHMLEELEVLDIGGAIHNLAHRVGYQGKLLVLNSDQFIMLSSENWKKFYRLSNEYDSVILTYDVKGEDLYNAVLSAEGKVYDIKSFQDFKATEQFSTYTGMAIINLESLDPLTGESKFFESVANYKRLNIGAMNIEDSHYWDFGTLKRYYQSMFEILKKWNEPDPFIEFLRSVNCLDEKLVDTISYNSKTPGVIDLAENSKHVSKSIYLKDSILKVPEENCIVMDDLIEILDLAFPFE